MTNIKRIENQTLTRIQSGKRYIEDGFPNLDLLDVMRDLRSNQREIKIALEKAFRKYKFYDTKWKYIEVDGGGYETHRRGFGPGGYNSAITFDFYAFNQRDDVGASVIGGGSWIVDYPEDYNEFEPESRKSIKAMESNITINCIVDLFEDQQPSGFEDEFEIQPNISYDSLIPYYKEEE